MPIRPPSSAIIATGKPRSSSPSSASSPTSTPSNSSARLAAAEFADRYAIERKQFGQSIANFQAIQWMIADNHTELDAARSLVLRAAWLKQQGRPFTREASMAKLYASERSFWACNRALQMLGGYGYTQDFPIERYLRDVRVTMIYEGTSEIQRIVIGRDVVRQFGS